MKKYWLVILLLIQVNISVSQEIYGVSYQPPLLPFSILLTNEGLSIKASGSVNTPIGEFSVHASKSLVKMNDESVKIVEKEVPKPIRIEVPKYIYKTKVVEKPVIKIKEVEKIVTKTIKDKEYVLELKNFKGKTSQEFIISGIDVFLLDVVGQTRIEARKGRITIDLSKSEITRINFRGGNFGIESFEERIANLCLEYNKTNGQIVTTREPRSSEKDENKKYLKGHGFRVMSDFENFENYRSAFRKLRFYENEFGIKYHDKSIAFNNGILVTKEGIGIEYYLSQKEKKVFKKREVIKQFRFFTWNEFFSVSYTVKENHMEYEQLYFSSLSNEEYDAFFSYTGSPSIGFTNNNYIQFFNEIKELVLKELE